MKKKKEELSPGELGWEGVKVRSYCTIRATGECDMRSTGSRRNMINISLYNI